MPIWRNGRPLKRWHYLGAYSSELMLCAGEARIGPLRQRFWAAATPDGRIRERTAVLGGGGLRLNGSRLAIDGPGLRARVQVGDGVGVVTVSRHGDSYIWTRKQAGVAVEGLVEIDGRPLQLDCRGVVDDSAGYHARHTAWAWSAGVGHGADDRPIAWNLVSGVHDDPRASERSIWCDGEPREVGPVDFASDLSSIAFSDGGELRFSAWGSREDSTNMLLLRSSYRQPFGTFSGELPGGLRLERGYGVMESHDVWW
ncbi:MAG: DUF2804 domain-containing protein [Thermoleophilaceae bacterium]